MSAAGVSFSEVMRGRLATRPSGEAGTRAVLRARITIDDLDEFLDDPNHKGRLEGAVLLPALSSDWFRASGEVQLFRMGTKLGERLMRYRADFLVNGAPHALVGDKFVYDDRGFDAWRDVTRLHAKVVRWHPSGPEEERLWSGTMSLSLLEAARLMTTLRGIGDAGTLARFSAAVRFARFFLAEAGATFLPRREA